MPKASEKRRSHRTRNGQIRQDHAFEESARPVAERNEPKRYQAELEPESKVCRLPQVTLGISPLFLARNSTDQSLFGGTERDLHYNDHTSGAGFQMVQAVDNQKPYHVGHPFPINNPTEHEDTSTRSHTMVRERGTRRWCSCNKVGEYEDFRPICEKCFGQRFMGPEPSSQMNQQGDHCGIQTPSECYRMPVSHKHSNDWTQHPTTSSDAPSSLFRPHPSERSRLMRGNAYSSAVSLQHRGPLLVNKQRVTPTRGQYPIVFGSSRGTDWPNLSTLLVDIRTTTWQFSSSTTSGSAASVTSNNDEFSSHGQEGVGDTHANRGLTSSEMVHSERGGESLRSYGPLNDQHEGSFAPVSWREAVQSQGTDFQPSLGVGDLNRNRPSHGDTQANRGLTSSVHSERREEINRVPKEREERTKKQREVTFPRCEDVSAGNEHQADAVRNSAVTKPSFGTSTNDVFSSHGQQEHGVVPALSGLPSSPQETPFWQCEHYQRRCTVKFPCCGVFYWCECCHNLSGECPANDKKACHATHVKCGNCGREEEINEESQTCRHCGVILSEYFCPECKFFMDVDKNPFHCEKCKICRLNKDTSFHCDVCNVCMGKQIEGKHKCRPDSGHDDCCICFEDVFPGCQILPCSHKIHKECGAKLMFYAKIENRVLTCPICRRPVEGHETEDPSQDG